MHKSTASALPSSGALDKIREHTLHFFGGTFVSRIFGYLRDVAMAYSFGASPLIALFLVGFRVSNLPRRIFGEGALQSILITHYQQTLLSHEEEGQRRLFQAQADFHKTWSLTLLGFIAIIMLALSGYEYVGNARGWISANYSLILAYTCLMMPGLWFICMSALNDAFLKVHRRFLIGSGAPVAFNIVWIALSLSMKEWTSAQAAAGLSCGIGLAYLMQWLVTYIGLRQEQKKEPIKERLEGQFLSPAVRKVIKPLFQGIIGVGATQINALLDAFFAMSAESAGPTYLWFAIRIEQAPLALIGLAISTAGLPALCAALEKREDQHAKQIFQFSQKRMISYMLGACSGMMCLAFIGVRLALEHGDFTPYDSFRTSQCLWGYSLGLMGQSLIFLYQNLAFSLHKYALVTRSSIYSVIFNVIANWFCISWLGWGAPAIALTTTLATFFQLLLIKKGIESRLNLFKIDIPWLAALKVVLLYSLTFCLTQLQFCWLFELPLSGFLQGTHIPGPTLSLRLTFSHFIQLSSGWLLCYLFLSYLLNLPLPKELLPARWRRRSSP